MTIAAAANVVPTLKKLVSHYESLHDVKIDIIIGSSGRLASQIQQGAPYDFFMSADMLYPEILFEKGIAITPPMAYAHGQLILWSINDSVSLSSLSSFEKIAIANPKFAPYGRAAKEVLKNNFDEKKLIIAQNIGQVDQYIISKSVQAGFSALSSALAHQKGHWTIIPDSMYTPLSQGMVILKGTHENQARSFYTFLLSKKSKEIFTSDGYL